MQEKIFYHGSNDIIKNPDLKHSRVDIDFGVGFYLTEDNMMAKKWACSKATSVVNNYKIDITGLSIYRFQLDQEWLEYVRANRLYEDHLQGILEQYEHYDILIGPTVEDKLYNTIQDYLDEEIDAETAVRYLNVAKHSEQIVLKTEKAISHVYYQSHTKIMNPEKREIQIQSRNEKQEALKELNALKRQNIGRKQR